MSTLFGETFGEKVKAMRHKYDMDQKTLAQMMLTPLNKLILYWVLLYGLFSLYGQEFAQDIL